MQGSWCFPFCSGCWWGAEYVEILMTISTLFGNFLFLRGGVIFFYLLELNTSSQSDIFNLTKEKTFPPPVKVTFHRHNPHLDMTLYTCIAVAEANKLKQTQW